MKWILLNLIIFISTTIVSAQQMKKSDDELLLEYYQSQKYADALNYLKSNYPEPVSDIKVLSRLAYTSQMAGQLAASETYYQRVYDLGTTNQSALFSIGNINLRRGNYLKAEIFFKKIILKDTANFAVLEQLAEISTKKKDSTAAVLYLKKANQVNPYDVNVASDLCEYLTAYKRFDPALKVLNKASEADPDNVILLMSMLNLTYTEQKWQATAEVCNKLISLGILTDQIFNKLGIAYYNLKNFACGAESFAGISPMGQNEYTFYYAALCYKALKDEKQAINMLNLALLQAISPNVASYYGEIADSESELSRYKKAAAAYTKGLQFSENATIYYLLASLYDTKLSDKANAAKYYKKYLASKPPVKQEKYIAFAKERLKEFKY